MQFLISILSVTLFLSTANSRYIQPYEENLEEMRILVLVDNDDKLHFLNYDAPKISSLTVEESEVTFHYKSRQVDSFELRTDNVEDIRKTDFDPNRRTMFIIHGWNNNKDSAMNKEISTALLQAEDWNVFIVDWQKKANSVYSVALGAVPGVGNVVAKFISLLQGETGANIHSINICGHSLGAHVAGQVGSVFQGEIETIVGLDPAFPFVEGNIDMLNISHAKYVQVIHTNAGFLGFSKQIGHTDFYPNGGKNQIGCGIDIFGKCSHSRSHIYFAESILNDNFKARYCLSSDDWDEGKCDNTRVAYMGGNTLDRIYGSFYLDTAARSPFALS